MILLIIRAFSEQILNVKLLVIFLKWDIMFICLQTTDLVLNPFVTHRDYAQQVYELYYSSTPAGFFCLGVPGRIK